MRALDSMIWGPVITARMKDSVLDPAKRNGITAPWVTLLEAQVNRRLHGGLARRLFRRAQRIYWRISESLQPRRKNR